MLNQELVALAKEKIKEREKQTNKLVKNALYYVELFKEEFGDLFKSLPKQSFSHSMYKKKGIETYWLATMGKMGSFVDYRYSYYADRDCNIYISYKKRYCSKHGW